MLRHARLTAGRAAARQSFADWWVYAWGLLAQLAYAPTTPDVRSDADARRWFRAGGHYHAALQRQRAGRHLH